MGRDQEIVTEQILKRQLAVNEQNWIRKYRAEELKKIRKERSEELQIIRMQWDNEYNFITKWPAVRVIMKHWAEEQIHKKYEAQRLAMEKGITTTLSFKERKLRNKVTKMQICREKRYEKEKPRVDKQKLLEQVDSTGRNIHYFIGVSLYTRMTEDDLLDEC